VAMIDFLYFGEANVYQENLDSFLAVAEELQWKGLMGSGADSEEEAEKTRNKTQPKLIPKLIHQKNYLKPEFKTYKIPNSVAKVESSPPQKGTVAVSDYTVAADLQDLNDKIKSMMEVSENFDARNRKNRICKVCGKEDSFNHISDHIESQHITGVSHTCNICGTTTRSRKTMAQHKRRNHTKN